MPDGVVAASPGAAATSVGAGTCLPRGFLGPSLAFTSPPAFASTLASPVFTGSVVWEVQPRRARDAIRASVEVFTAAEPSAGPDGCHEGRAVFLVALGIRRPRGSWRPFV